jgi:hypothetical protein
MKRLASIVLLLTLLLPAVSPLLAQIGPSHPAACPREVKPQQTCHGSGSASETPVIEAKSAECPMRCCPTLRAGADFSPAERALLTTLVSTSLEVRIAPSSAFVSTPQVHFERGPPRA